MPGAQLSPAILGALQLCCPRQATPRPPARPSALVCPQARQPAKRDPGTRLALEGTCPAPTSSTHGAGPSSTPRVGPAGDFPPRATQGILPEQAHISQGADGRFSCTEGNCKATFGSYADAVDHRLDAHVCDASASVPVDGENDTLSSQDEDNDGHDTATAAATASRTTQPASYRQQGHRQQRAGRQHSQRKPAPGGPSLSSAAVDRKGGTPAIRRFTNVTFPGKLATASSRLMPMLLSSPAAASLPQIHVAAGQWDADTKRPRPLLSDLSSPPPHRADKMSTDPPPTRHSDMTLGGPLPEMANSGAPASMALPAPPQAPSRMHLPVSPPAIPSSRESSATGHNGTGNQGPTGAMWTSLGTVQASGTGAFRPYAFSQLANASSLPPTTQPGLVPDLPAVPKPVALRRVDLLPVPPAGAPPPPLTTLLPTTAAHQTNWPPSDAPTASSPEPARFTVRSLFGLPLAEPSFVMAASSQANGPVPPANATSDRLQTPMAHAVPASGKATGGGHDVTMADVGDWDNGAIRRVGPAPFRRSASMHALTGLRTSPSPDSDTVADAAEMQSPGTVIALDPNRRPERRPDSRALQIRAEQAKLECYLDEMRSNSERLRHYQIYMMSMRWEVDSIEVRRTQAARAFAAPHNLTGDTVTGNAHMSCHGGADAARSCQSEPLRSLPSGHAGRSDNGGRVYYAGPPTSGVGAQQRRRRPCGRRCRQH